MVLAVFFFAAWIVMVQPIIGPNGLPGGTSSAAALREDIEIVRLYS